MKFFLSEVSNFHHQPKFLTCNYHDEVAEWLRRWTANPMGSARVGSNPILVDNFDLHKFLQIHEH